MGVEVDSTPLYQSLFKKVYYTCQMFPALEPLTIRKTKAREVFLLFRRIETLVKDMEKETKHNKKKNKKNSNTRTKEERIDITGQANPSWF